MAGMPHSARIPTEDTAQNPSAASQRLHSTDKETERQRGKRSVPGNTGFPLPRGRKADACLGVDGTVAELGPAVRRIAL